MTLRTLPAPLRLLFSCFLVTMGLGYLAAGTLLFLGTIDPHQEMGMGLVRAVAAKYYGERNSSRLESALRGTMSARISPEGRETVIGWVRDGAPRDSFDPVKPILDRSCAACHNPKSGLPIPPLTSFEDAQKLAQVDAGPTLAELARVSHVHLFGISFIFLLTGGIFALSETAPGWRAFILALPYLTIWADIGAWWVTKFEPAFAWVVVVSGAIMALALAVQIFIPLWEMWFARRGAPLTGEKA